jgi:hypothetical protein
VITSCKSQNINIFKPLETSDLLGNLFGYFLGHKIYNQIIILININQFRFGLLRILIHLDSPNDIVRLNSVYFLVLLNWNYFYCLLIIWLYYRIVAICHTDMNVKHKWTRMLQLRDQLPFIIKELYDSWIILITNHKVILETLD